MKFNWKEYFIEHDGKLLFISFAVWLVSYVLFIKIVRPPEMPFWPFWLSLLACCLRPTFVLVPLLEDKRQMLIKWLTTNDRIFFKGKTGYLKVEDAERLLDEVTNSQSGGGMSFIPRHVFYCLAFNLFAFLLSLSVGYSAVIKECDRKFRPPYEIVKGGWTSNPYKTVSECVYMHKEQLFNHSDWSKD